MIAPRSLFFARIDRSAVKVGSTIDEPTAHRMRTTKKITRSRNEREHSVRDEAEEQTDLSDSRDRRFAPPAARRRVSTPRRRRRPRPRAASQLALPPSEARGGDRAQKFAKKNTIAKIAKNWRMRTRRTPGYVGRLQRFGDARLCFACACMRDGSSVCVNSDVESLLERPRRRTETPDRASSKIPPSPARR